MEAALRVRTPGWSQWRSARKSPVRNGLDPVADPRKRERHWAGRPVSSYLFVSSWGNRLDNGQIHRAFYAVSRRVGLRGATDRHGPRLHDLRQNAESRKMPSDTA